MGFRTERPFTLLPKQTMKRVLYNASECFSRIYSKALFSSVFFKIISDILEEMTDYN